MNICASNKIILSKDQVSRLNNLGNFTIFNPGDSEEKLSEIIENADILIVWNSFNSLLIPKLKKCKLMAVWATGYDYINVDAATKKGIMVANVPSYSTDAVAEQTFALVLGFIKKIRCLKNFMLILFWR